MNNNSTIQTGARSDRRLSRVEPTSAGRRLSWGAVIAGVIAAFVVQLTLGVLGIAIGAATVDAAGTVGIGMGIGTVVWFAIVAIAGMFAGGWVAARMANIPRRTESILHGVLTWGVSNVVVVALAGVAVGALFSGAIGALGGGINLTGADLAQLPAVAAGVADAVPEATASLPEAAAPAAGSFFMAFALLLLGGGAAAWGGAKGTPRNTVLENLP